ncbi:mevalonate kinase [Gardnerella sp. Marseille-Q2328]|uniref:mevalonate kinase n=1 Tax=Gardnerella sp. Marseille-Q2328 TaxID=2759694 RepID=UPI002025B431|nr:mevalonate kinase [Gardnerella sp. Marseille-Q2328]
MLQSKYELADELNLSVKAHNAGEIADCTNANHHCATSASATSASATSESLRRSGYGETCAKVILFGEHSVVYGHSAVALPLKNLRMRATVVRCNSVDSDISATNETSATSVTSTTSVTFATGESTPNPDSQITLSCLGFTGKLSDIPPRFSSIRAAIREALKFAKWNGEPLHVTTKSDFPPERGLGSSAAAAGAVIRAILDYYGARASDDELFELTQAAERVAHGCSSGLDATATSASWPVRFKCGEFSRMDICMRAWLVLADSGCKGMTRSTVEGLRARLDAHPDEVGVQLDNLGAIAAEAEADLALGRVESMGVRMTRAHKILADLGVSTPQLDKLVRVACEHGALGAKLTGGGGGGCVIALADTAAAAERISAALREAGACGTWIVNIGGDSAR